MENDNNDFLFNQSVGIQDVIFLNFVIQVKFHNNFYYCPDWEFQSKEKLFFSFLKVIFATKVNFTSWIVYAITIRCTLNPSKFLKNILTLCIIIQYYYYFITLQVYILMLTPIALDPPKRVHRLTLLLLFRADFSKKKIGF